MHLDILRATAVAVAALAVAGTSVAQRSNLLPGQSNAQPKLFDALGTTDLNTLTPNDLAQALVGAGVTVSNVTYAGVPIAAGTFTGGAGIVGFDNGVILSSGNIASVPGPNTAGNTTTNNGQPGDPDLEMLIPFTQDASVLEFDFECTGASNITFQYVFSSEEYNEYVNSSFNDVFGFFLNGTNIALLPVSGNPVAINNVNCGNPFTGMGPNCTEYINNHCGQGGLPGYPCAGNRDTEMDGLTVVFTATSAINPGVNHLKLAIADVGDSAWDSNVFIRGASLSCSTPAPFFDAPSPCGQTIGGSVGVPISYTVVAKAATGQPGNAITLTASGLPATATQTPPLPLSDVGPNATAASVFSWTPVAGEEGTYVITYTGTDQLGQVATCTVVLEVAECYLFLGLQAANFPLGPDPDDTVLVAPLTWWPVTTVSIPELTIPNSSFLLNLEIFTQVGMFNPTVFPTNPLQLSNGWKLVLGSHTESYPPGFSTGIDLSGLPVPQLGSNYSFSFTIN